MPEENSLNRIRLSRDYPRNPRERYTRKPEAIGGDVEDVDAAIVGPVRMMNNIIGFKTYASCEGHLDPNNPNTAIKPGPDDTMPVGEPFASYIGFYLPICDHGPLVDFLCDHGFFATAAGYYSLGRATGNNGTRIYIKYDGGAVLTYSNGGRLEGDTFMVRIGAEPRDMLYSQEEWDYLRDKGWETWLNLFDQYIHICQPE